MNVDFVPSDGLLGRAASVHRRERDRLAALVPDGELELTGASSVPGMLTSGDVDLHLRVVPGRFADALAELSRCYAIAHPEIWSQTLATFVVADDPLVGVAVTPIGSVHDRRFRLAWRRLRSDPAAVEAYNELKRSHAGGELADYLAAKSTFFDSLVDDLEGGR